MLNSRKYQHNQKGIASILVVTILVLLLSLVSIGYSRLINRDIRNSVEDQKAKIASYAAESGINQVIGLLKQSSPLTNNNLSKCQNDLLNNLNSTTGLSGDKSTEYTCVLLNTKPKDLIYQKIQPYTSKIVKLQAGAPMTSIFVSWQSAVSNNNFINGKTHLLDEGNWNKNGYTPMLRVTLYSIPSNKALKGSGYSAHTYFLYPKKSGGQNTLALTGAGSVADGSLQDVGCDQRNFNGYPYQSPGSNYCSIVFNGLPNTGDNGSYFYLRVTPLYGAADVNIAAQVAASESNNGLVAFSTAQAVIDVSAKSNDVVKRLQARASISGNNGSGSDVIPEFALRSAATICKRYIVDSNTVIIDPNSVDTCGIGHKGIGPVAITGGLSTIPTNDCSRVRICDPGPPHYVFDGKVQPNAPAATYYFNYGKYDTKKKTFAGSPSQVPTKPGANLKVNRGEGFFYPVSVTGPPTSNFDVNVTYGYQLCAINKVAENCGVIKTFINKPPSGGSSSGGGFPSSGSEPCNPPYTAKSVLPPDYHCPCPSGTIQDFKGICCNPNMTATDLDGNKCTTCGPNGRDANGNSCSPSGFDEREISPIAYQPPNLLLHTTNSTGYRLPPDLAATFYLSYYGLGLAEG